MAVSELADWWDDQKKQSEKVLEEWVQDNPQWWVIGIATFTQTAMDLGAGTVDALRFGEGIAKGTPGGVATDAMRLLVIVGPVAKGLGAGANAVSGMLRRLAYAKNLKFAVSLKGMTGPCTFQAVNNAASLLGGKGKSLFLTVQQAASALGKPLVQNKSGVYKLAAWIDDLVPFLIKQGLRVRSLGIPKTIDDVVAAASANNGVVVFAIKWIDTAGKARLHSMIAVRTAQGVRFADYGGKFISNLAELAKRGGIWARQPGTGYSIASGVDKGAAVLIGEPWVAALSRFGSEVFKGGLLLLEGLHAVETPDDGVDLAIPVEAAAAIETQAHEPEVVKQSFAAFKARKEGRPVVRLDPIRIVGRRNGPPRSDWLTGVQYRLNALGFGAGPVDGINGPKTKQAVREFQRTYMSPADVDEIPGPRTQARLVEICGF